jgi:PDZ domain-containing secreted protein
MFELRNFGKRCEFNNSAELTNHLNEHHLGDHVSVTYKRPSGIKGIVFVSITESGIRESNGNLSPVDFDAFVK